MRWSGARDSITTREETLDAVAGALLDWRTFLEDLAELFPQYLPLPAEPGAAAVAWEATVASLVATVAARSGEDEFWYPMCAVVLKWFLAVAEVPGEDHDALVDYAIGGRFRSSVSPLGAEVADAAESLAATLTGVTPPPDGVWPDTWPQDWPSRRSTELPAAARAPRIKPPAAPDALATWQQVRRTARWDQAAEHVRSPVHTARDGIAEHLAKRRYGAGRRPCRAGPRACGRGRGRPPHLRASGGVATEGARRRRRAVPDEVCLGAGRLGAVPVPRRATGGIRGVSGRGDRPGRAAAVAGHPGVPRCAALPPVRRRQRRSAALALYFVLAREGVVLDRAAPLLMTRWPASDPRGAEGLAGFIAVLVEQTSRQQPTPPADDAISAATPAIATFAHRLPGRW